MLQARTGATTTQYLYSLGTRPIAEYEAAAWEYLLPDALGSVRQIANSGGSMTLLKSYEPYGSVLNSQGSATSMFGYACEQTDASVTTYTYDAANRLTSVNGQAYTWDQNGNLTLLTGCEEAHRHHHIQRRMSFMI